MTEKITNEPQEIRVRKPMGWLKNGNPPGDPLSAPRCGAKRRGREELCKAPAMANGRCRLHGGKSTGPKTQEGLERSKRANWRHGEHSKEALEEIKEIRKALKMLKPSKRDEAVDGNVLKDQCCELLEALNKIPFLTS